MTRAALAVLACAAALALPAPSSGAAPPKPAPSASPAAEKETPSKPSPGAGGAPRKKPGRSARPKGTAARGAPYFAEGVVRSDRRVEIKSKIAAPVRRIPVEEGGAVRQGDLMVEMTNDAEKAQLEAARAEVERAKSALTEADLLKKTAEREYERNKSVADLITAKELEMSRDMAAQAAATREMRQKELAKAEAMVTAATAVYDNTLIRAPFDGVVSRIYVRPGAMPKVADTTLLDIVALDALYVEVAVPLQYLKRVKAGMSARLTVDDNNSSTHAETTGQVRLVYSEVDPTTRMFRVKIDIERKDSKIKPGMFAKVNLGLN